MANTIKATTTGFNLTCPFCDSGGVAFALDLNDLNEIQCDNCDEKFTAEQAVSKLTAAAEKWARVARWIEAASTV